MTAALTPPLSPTAEVDLSALARAPRLLLALDFDGVLAPLRDDPTASRMMPESAEAVAALTALPGTRVALVSGRDVATLRRLAAPPPGVWLVGSHGAEADLGGAGAESGHEGSGERGAGVGADSVPAPATNLTKSERGLLADLDSRLESLSDLHIERKPFSRTVHTRGLDAARLTSAETRLSSVAEALAAFRVIVGHDIVEFAVRTVTKGDGVRGLLAAARPDAVLCLGDDVTDEDAFTTLAEVRAESPSPTTLSIKVGTAPTCADARIADPAAVAALLMRLAAERAHAQLAEDSRTV